MDEPIYDPSRLAPRPTLETIDRDIFRINAKIEVEQADQQERFNALMAAMRSLKKDLDRLWKWLFVALVILAAIAGDALWAS